MKNKHIYFFIGTTTELIRISPVLKELKRRKMKYKIISSGQNRIHTEQLNKYLKDIKIDISFKEKGNKSSAVHFALWSIQTLFSAIFNLRNEFKNLNKSNCHFIIFGDPVSTSIGAIVAKFYRLNLVHLESGDMSFDLREPFPEEICRNINIRLADVLFPPGNWAMENLSRIKAITNHRINTFYNTQLEVFLWAMKSKPSASIKKTIKKLGSYYILILHRQEHVFFRKEWSRETLKFVLNNSKSDLNVVMFDHPLSKQIVNSIKPLLKKEVRKNIKTLSLIPYSDFLHLMNNAEFIASDSATNQYEAYLLGKPYLALREKVEQVEGINKNVVVSKGNQEIMKKFLHNYIRYNKKPITPKKRPSEIIVDYLQNN